MALTKPGLCGMGAPCAMLLACMLFCLTRTAYAQGLKVVYVESNIGAVSNQNSLFGFSNDGQGNLTPLAGSPYLTSGTGFMDVHGTSIGTDNQVIIRKDGNLLFAVNAHTNTIAVFNINADGSLAAVPGSPFPSGGEEPLSLALSDDFLAGDTDILTVVNRANESRQPPQTPNFTTFKVSSAGILTPASQFSLPRVANPTQVTSVGPHGKFVFASQVGSSLVTGMLYSFTLQPDASMKLNNSLSFPNALNLLGNVAHPTRHILYTGQPGRVQVGVYNWDATNGNLSLIRTVPNHGASLCWLTINAGGTRLYTVENTSGTVTVYDLSNPTLPIQIQHVLLSGAKPGPTNMKLDATGNFAYVVDVAQQALHLLNVNADGTLTETKSPTPLPGLQPGDMPIGLATLSR